MGEDSPGGRNGNPFQYSCLQNPIDRVAWQGTIQKDHKESDRTERLSIYKHMCNCSIREKEVGLTSSWLSLDG